MTREGGRPRPPFASRQRALNEKGSARHRENVSVERDVTEMAGETPALPGSPVLAPYRHYVVPALIINFAVIL
jgi:hypothetical protein